MDKVQILLFTINFINIFARIIVWAIIVRIILSWFKMGKPGPRGKLTQVLHDVTDPVINLARKLPHKWGMIDFAPLIALIGVDIISKVVITLLADSVMKMTA